MSGTFRRHADCYEDDGLDGRPATPDGTPVVGGTRFGNLYLNTGHGTLGWTMACGSGRYLADLIAGAVPDISSEGLDISRYGKHRGPNTTGREPCRVTFVHRPSRMNAGMSRGPT